MSKRQKILPTRAGFFTPSAAKIESAREFKVFRVGILGDNIASDNLIIEIVCSHCMLTTNMVFQNNQ